MRVFPGCKFQVNVESGVQPRLGAVTLEHSSYAVKVGRTTTH